MKLSDGFRNGGLVSVAALLALAFGLVSYGITEEVPIGQFRGSVSMAENAMPLAGATVVMRPVDGLETGERKVSVTRADENGNFAFERLVAGGYILEAYGRAHKLEKTGVLVKEGEPLNLDLELQPQAPYLDLYVNQHVFTPGEAPELQVHGFGPEQQLDIKLFRIDAQTVVGAGGLYDSLRPYAYEGRAQSAKPTEAEVREIESRDAEGVFEERLKLDVLPEGVYWVSISHGARTAGSYLMISRIGMVVKSDDDQALAFVTDIDTGAPIAGARVTAGELGSATTNDEGIAEIRFPAGDGRSAVLVASSGSSSAIAGFYRYQRSKLGARFFTTTDRPVYRPGDTVQYKAVARIPNGTGYRLPEPGTAKVTIRDPDGREVETQSRPVNQVGSLDGSFKTAEGVVGGYSIEIEFAGGEAYHSVPISAYRKPAFNLDISPEKPFYTANEQVTMVAKAEYYFGGPVIDAELSVLVFRAPLWYDPTFDTDSDSSESEWYEGWESSYDGELVAELKATTDSNGVAKLKYRLDPDERERWEGGTSRLTFVVTATEDSNQYFDGRGQVRLAEGEFALRGQFESYVSAPNEPVALTIEARNHDGSPRAGAEIELESGYENWTRGGSVWEPAGKQKVITDAEGKATVSLTPLLSGNYRVRMEARDRSRNSIRANTDLYVYESGREWSGEPAPALQLILDKRDYDLGDTATGMIRTSKTGGAALVTVEADGLLEHRVVRLDSDVTTFELPVVAAYKPNVFVSVATIHEKQFRSATRSLNVDLRAERLNVTIEPDRETLEPGQSVTYALATTREDGTPVSADVAFGVVDEAIYDIMEDRDDPLREFYPRRYNAVNTSYSFEELYLDGGDKSPNDTEVRDDFVDTAFWMPSVMTDASGRASLTVRMPDNLTSWRATATAISADTAVGKSTANVRVRKDLMVRLVPPGYLVEDDRIRVSALVTNDTGRSVEVNVRLEASGLRLEGGPNQRVRVGQGRTEQVDWFAVPSDPGEATFTATASVQGGASDAVRQSAPIVAHGREMVIARSGPLGESTTGMTVSRRARTSAGTVRLEISATPGGTILGSLEDLVDYPYGCVEQTMSRFMPAVVAARTMRDLNRPQPELEEKVPEVVRRSLAKLREHRNWDGGFGWFEGNQSNPEMTALVLEGLWRSEQAGEATDRFLIDGALEFARQQLPQSLPEAGLTNVWPTRAYVAQGRTYLAYAAALHGEREQSSAFLRTVELKDLDASHLALLAMAAHRLGSPDLVAKRDQALNALLSAATRDSSGVRWSEGWGSEATARALQALLLIRPESPEIPRIVQGLMVDRRGSGWTSTRDTAQVLVGLTEHLRRIAALTGEGTFTVMRGDEVWGVLRVSPETILSDSLVLEAPITEFAEGDTAVSVIRQGDVPGGFFSFSVKQIPSVESIGALVNDSGISVERTFHTLAAQRLQDGSLRLMPSKNSILRFESGQPVRCLVRVRTRRALDFAMVHVPVPANLRVNEIDNGDAWNWWWSGMEVHDDHVGFFVERLEPGEHVFELNLRAEAPGTAAALPTDVYNMYAPEVRGSSSAVRVEVTP